MKGDVIKLLIIPLSLREKFIHTYLFPSYIFLPSSHISFLPLPSLYPLFHSSIVFSLPSCEENIIVPLIFSFKIKYFGMQFFCEIIQLAFYSRHYFYFLVFWFLECNSILHVLCSILSHSLLEPEGIFGCVC